MTTKDVRRRFLFIVLTLFSVFLFSSISEGTTKLCRLCKDFSRCTSRDQSSLRWNAATSFPLPHRYAANRNEDRWRRRWKRWESLSPEEKERLRSRYRQWRRLPPRKRKKLLSIYETLKKMPPEERRKLIPLIRRWNTLTPEERGYVLKKLRQYGFDNSPRSI